MPKNLAGIFNHVPNFRTRARLAEIESRGFDQIKATGDGPMEGSRLELGEPIKDAISRIRFAPRSNNLLISSWDSILRLYDVDGSVLRLEALSEGALLDCCFENETTALTAGSDGCIRRYNLCSGTQDVVGEHDDAIACIEYSEETGQFVTSSLDKKLKFWDIRMNNGNSLCACTIESDVRSMSLCGVYLLVAIGSTVEMHDLRNLKGPVHTKESSMDFQIRCVRSFPKCHGYVTGSVDGCVAVKYFDPAMECEMGSVFDTFSVVTQNQKVEELIWLI